MKKILSFVTSECVLDNRLAVLYFLNLSDYLFTVVLISSGLFIEVNPLLTLNIDGTGGFLAKCILPLLLVLYIRLRVINDPPKKIFGIKLLLDVLMSFYIFVNCFHVFWLSYTIMIFM